METRALAALVLQDLELILQRTRAAYVERLPALRRQAPATIEGVLAATRRTMEMFCRYVVEGTLDADSWRAVRDATIERAGEAFSEEEILEIMDIARGVGMEVVRELWRGHPELTDEERAEVARAIDRYVWEIAEQEDRLRALNPESLDAVLADLEADDADLR